MALKLTRSLGEGPACDSLLENSTASSAGKSDVSLSVGVQSQFVAQTHRARIRLQSTVNPQLIELPLVSILYMSLYVPARHWSECKRF